MSNQLENNFYREIGLTGTLDDMRKQFYSTDGAGMVRAETNPVTGGIRIPNLSQSASCAAIGDSIVAGVVSGGSPYNQAARSYGSSVRNIGNYAVGGKTAVQILSEQVPIASTSGASICLVGAGTNDLLTNAAPTSVIGTVKEIYARLSAAGVTPVQMGMQPTNKPAYVSAFATTEAAKRLLAYATGVAHADIWTALANYAGGFTESMNADDTHVSVRGAIASAERIRLAIAGEKIKSPLIALTDTGANQGSAISNALTFTGGGTLPTGWATYGSSGSPTYSVVPPETGEWGNWLRCTLTDASSNTGMLYQVQLNTAGINIGDKIAVAVRLRWVSDDASLIVNNQLWAPVFSNTAHSVHPVINEGGVNARDLYVFWTGVVSSGTHFAFYVYGKGTGYFEIQAPATANLTKLGLADFF